MESESQLDAKQKQEMEIEDLNRKHREKISRIVEEHKIMNHRKKEELLKKIHVLKRQIRLETKLKIEREIEGLKEKLQVVKRSGDEDDTALQRQIKQMNNELEAKMKEMEVMNQTRA